MNKIALSILLSIILTIIIVSIVNVGTSLFLHQPGYDEYCGNITKAVVGPDESVAQIELSNDCYQRYDDAMKPYNQHKFYVFAVIGFALLILGLFVVELLFQITFLASGGILVFEGIVTNLQDKLIVFIALLAILVIFGILAYRVIRKK